MRRLLPILALRALAVGPENYLWLAGINTGESPSNVVGRISPGGAVDEYAVPATAGVLGIGDLTRGAEGDMWFTEPAANRIERVAPTGHPEGFTLPTAGSLPTAPHRSAGRGRDDADLDRRQEGRRPGLPARPLRADQGPLGRTGRRTVVRRRGSDRALSPLAALPGQDRAGEISRRIAEAVARVPRRRGRGTLQGHDRSGAGEDPDSSRRLLDHDDDEAQGVAALRRPGGKEGGGQASSAEPLRRPLLREAGSDLRSARLTPEPLCYLAPSRDPRGPRFLRHEPHQREKN